MPVFGRVLWLALLILSFCTTGAAFAGPPTKADAPTAVTTTQDGGGPPTDAGDGGAPPRDDRGPPPAPDPTIVVACVSTTAPESKDAGVNADARGGRRHRSAV